MDLKERELQRKAAAQQVIASEKTEPTVVEKKTPVISDDNFENDTKFCSILVEPEVKKNFKRAVLKNDDDANIRDVLVSLIKDYCGEEYLRRAKENIIKNRNNF